ncbi:MAG: cytochrome c biogenesis protein CcsA [Thermomicrobiaceae bacterium]
MSPGGRFGNSSTGPALAVGAGLTMIIALYMMFLYAPTDSVQGPVQRVFYLHLPMAWIAYLAFFIVFVASIAYLVTRSRRWDQLARSSAEVGLVFTTLVIITGSLWGRPIWGTFWEWDARLTTTLILWFIYLGYFMIRSYIPDQERSMRYAAIIGIIGFIDVPIIHMSVRWWRTLHPEPIVTQSGGPAMPDSMIYTMGVALLAMTLFFASLVYQKLLVEQARDELSDYQVVESDRQADAAERVTA